MVRQIWRHERVHDGTLKRAGAKKPPVKKMYAESQMKYEVIKEALEKLLKPPYRGETP